MKYLPIDQVQDGMVLVRPIFDDRGKLMLNSNTRLTAHFIRRIKSMGFEKIYVYVILTGSSMILLMMGCNDPDIRVWNNILCAIWRIFYVQMKINS